MNRKKKENTTPEGGSENSKSPNDTGEQWDDLMTTRELMAFLNLSRTKIWGLVTKGDLPAFKVGGDYRYRRSEILEWLEKHRVRR